MPHTSSRRRQRQMAPHSTKLVPQVADDGWTHVVRKSASPAASSSTICTAVANASNSIHATGSDALLELLTPAQLELYNSLGWQGSQDDVGRQTGPRPQQPRCSELELNKKLGHVRSAWRGSTICKRIKNVLVEAGVLHVEDPADALASLSLGGSVNMEAKREALEPEDSYNKSRVDKVICLGLGSPNADPSGWRSTVLWQLAAFLEIAELLSSPGVPASNGVFQLYAQDPVFNEVDISFLSSLRITVLETPQAFSLIDARVVVYAPHYPIAGWSAQMRQGLAGCVIGNDVSAATSSGRVLSEKQLLELFAHVRSSGMKPEEPTDIEATDTGGKADTCEQRSKGSTLSEIPDLHAKDELQHFLQTHEAMRWPEPEGGMAEGAFNDMLIYWSRSRKNGEQDEGTRQSTV